MDNPETGRYRLDMYNEINDKQIEGNVYFNDEKVAKNILDTLNNERLQYSYFITDTYENKLDNQKTIVENNIQPRRDNGDSL